mgnify:FL=1
MLIPPFAALNGIIQGILPPVALSVLFIFLPIILRLAARFQGIPLVSRTPSLDNAGADIGSRAQKTQVKLAA